jgi:hypothetical protein
LDASSESTAFQHYHWYWFEFTGELICVFWLLGFSWSVCGDELNFVTGSPLTAFGR